MLAHWMIVVSGLDKVDDIRRAPEDVFSMMENFTEVVVLAFPTWQRYLTQLRGQICTHPFVL